MNKMKKAKNFLSEHDVWRKIPGFEGFYEANKKGEIRSIPRKKRHPKGGYSSIDGQVLKQNKGKQGYIRLTLCKLSERSWCLSHRLIAETWIPNPENKSCINHKNGIKDDNNVSNLEWVTYSENNTHAYRVLNKSPTRMMDHEHPNSKNVSQYSLSGKFIKEFWSASGAARHLIGMGFLKASPVAVSLCCRQERKTAYGFVYKYV